MRFGAFARLFGSDCRYFAQPVFIWKFTYLVLLIPKFVLSPFDFFVGLFFDPSPRLLRGERICLPTHVVAPSVRDPAFRFPPRASRPFPLGQPQSILTAPAGAPSPSGSLSLSLLPQQEPLP